MPGRFNITATAFAACAFGLAAFAADTLYTVKNGDTLSDIANRNGLTTKSLAAANAMKDADGLSIGQKIRIPSAASGAPATAPARTASSVGARHIVKVGDTLSEIAATHGTTADALARLNQIRDPKELRVGQTLTLPSAAERAQSVAAAATPLPAALRKQLDAQKVVAGKWRYIVVHHSATAVGSARNMELYHHDIRHMENGLAYHFVIGNGRGMGDGEVAIGNRWRRQIKGGHLASDRLNEKSIGICLVGNFEVNRPSQRQLQSLYALVNYLEERCHTPADAVKVHRQINTKPTMCPGRLFPVQSLLTNT